MDNLAQLAKSEEVEEFDNIQVGKIMCFIIKRVEAISILINLKPTWLDEITFYLKMGACPEDPIEVRRLRIMSARYILIDDALYK